MDKATIGGIVLAIGCILGGQALEGGHASSLMQATAAIIVIGGTIGATAVAFPIPDFIAGIKIAKQGLTQKKNDLGKVIAELMELAALARRDGVLALEGKLAEIKDPFLKRRRKLA